MKRVVLVAALAAGCSAHGVRDDVAVTNDPVSVASEQKLLCPDALGLDSFGQSVHLDGDTLIVGAPGHDDNGAAYVFVRDASKVWRFQQKLPPPSPTRGGLFGTAVAVEGDTAVVTGGGTAYVFMRSGLTWTYSRAASVRGSAASVALEGDTLVVGDSQALVDAVNGAGEVKVFARDNGAWDPVQTLNAPMQVAFTHFGKSVALNGDWLVVGAPGDENNSGDYMEIGSAYFFHRSAGTWVYERRASNELYDGFGVAVRVQGDTAAVGISNSYLDDGFNGVVRLYSLAVGNVARGATLKASDGKAYDHFGTSLALRGARMFIGAPGWDSMNVHSGAGYVFELSGGSWREKLRVLPTYTSTVYTLEAGRAAALSDDVAVLSSPLDHEAGNNSGSAFAFALNPDEPEPDAGDAGPADAGTELDGSVSGDSASDSTAPDVVDAGADVVEAGVVDVAGDVATSDATGAADTTADADADAAALDAPATPDSAVANDAGADAGEASVGDVDASHAADASDAAPNPALDAAPNDGSPASPSGDDGGCSCAVFASRPPSASAAWLVLLAALASRRRKQTGWKSSL